MATIRHNPRVPTVTSNRKKRIGRPPKPRGEVRDHFINVGFTEREYEALAEYQSMVMQPSETAAARAAVLTVLRSAGVLKDPSPET